MNETHLWLLGPAAMLATAALFLHRHLTGNSLFLVLAPLLAAAACAAYVLLAVRGWRALHCFRGAGWRCLGSISNGLYLIHQPVAGALRGLVLGGRPDVGTCRSSRSVLRP